MKTIKYLEKLKKNVGFDQYSRYETFRRIIEHNREDKEVVSVLDVGGRGNRMAQFLPFDKVYYLDPLIETDDANFIQGDGCDIPLDDNSYDWLVSADVFEHIPKNLRTKYLSEQIRVAKKGVIISAPFKTEYAIKAEKEINKVYKEIFGVEHPWLKEHFENGLPEEAVVEKYFEDNHFQYTKFYNNEISIWKSFLELTIHFDSKYLTNELESLKEEINFFYNNSIYKKDTLNFNNNSYRRIYFVKKDQKLKDIKTPKKVEINYSEVNDFICAMTKRLLRSTHRSYSTLKEEFEKLKFKFEHFKEQKEHELNELIIYKDKLEAMLNSRSVKMATRISSIFKGRKS